VAGGIPFLDALLKLSALEPIRGYEGIFNGTSNYILDRMQKEGLKFEDVLKEAQKLGYAEADPANDVEGTDVWYKTKIANMLAYHTKDGGLHKPLGISKLTENDVRMAKKYGRTIRHISRSTSDGKTYASIIAPAFLKEDNYLASVPSNYNAQLIFADSFDKLGYFGQGAGQMATAQAMLADALDTLSGRRRELDFSKELKENPALLTSKWLIRTNADIPAELVEKKEDGYVWTKPAGITFVDEILAQDPNAMAALWD
jgi:homoserine dehydrogenase